MGCKVFFHKFPVQKEVSEGVLVPLRKRQTHAIYTDSDRVVHAWPDREFRGYQIWGLV